MSENVIIALIMSPVMVLYMLLIYFNLTRYTNDKKSNKQLIKEISFLKNNKQLYKYSKKLDKENYYYLKAYVDELHDKLERCDYYKYHYDLYDNLTTILQYYEMR